MIRLKWKMNRKGLYGCYWLGYRVVRFNNVCFRVYLPNSLVDYKRLTNEQFHNWITGSYDIIVRAR